MLSKIKHVQIAQIIKVDDTVEHSNKERIVRKYRVIAIYPFHVLCVDKIGIKRCFSYGHLIQLGYEKQKPDIEAIRKLQWARGLSI